MKRIMLLVIVFVFLCLGGIVQANVFNMASGLENLETVTVGNPGNTGETSGNGGWAGPIRTCGAVSYPYKIGKYEVTAAQYADFLNAVAKTDTYGLYNTSMASDEGCHITRSGSSGNYTYSVTSGWENRPVNFVSWGDAGRFVNWLHNGQPTGSQGITTTEDGAYYINGKTSNADLLTVTRESDWRFAVPTEDEWYKAAYHKNDGVTGNYWDYPTGSNSEPGRNFNGTNDANYYSGGYLVATYYRNTVCQFVNCPSPYGAFDMGGNIYEWNDTIGLKSDGVTSTRGQKGGSYWHNGSHYMLAIARYFMYDPSFEHASIGFRIVAKPVEGEAQIDGSGILLVDGEPFLPIGYIGVIPWDMETIAQIGGNTVQSYNAYYWSQQDADEYMDEAAEHDLKVVLLPWGSVDDYWRTTTSLSSEEITRMTNQVLRFRDHPNFLAWYLYDEPESVGVPVSRLLQAYDLVRRLDPWHPVIILNDSAAGIADYRNACDISMPDPYCQPTLTGFTRPMTLVSDWMDQIETSDPTLAAWACLQAFDYGEIWDSLPTDRAPTLDEFRSMTWLAVNHGCKGFIHFAWPYIFNYPDLYLGLPYIFQEVNALSGVVMSSDMAQVTPQSGTVDASVTSYGGATWVIVVNASTSTQAFSLYIPALGSSELNAVGEDITRQASSGVLSDTLASYQTRIYTTGDPDFDPRIADVRASIAVMEGLKRKPGNIAFWMTNGTTVDANSWNCANRFTSPRSVTNGVISDDEGWLDNNANFPDWITLTWPTSKVISKVKLYWHNLYEYDVQYLSGGNWITLRSCEDDSGLKQETEITFPPVSTTAIRIYVYSTYGNYLQLSEVECYSDVETVMIGNAGNTGETSGNGGWAGPVRTCGAVDYPYKIGTYEITAAQYAEFLNAVADTDTYGLYNTSMSSGDGCRIIRGGSSGSYTYSVSSGWENRPANYVSWGDAVRFVNWLHNGKPTGSQDSTTTEDGAYYINGKTSNGDLLTVTRESGWRFAVPTEDEWYKAAYHKNDGVTGNYWDYPTVSDSEPGRNFNGTNDANYYSGGYLVATYYRNTVGQFVNCPSPYGAFDMGGNVYEWNETIGLKSDGITSTRGHRGGSYWHDGSHYMLAIARYFMWDPSFEHASIGSRIVESYVDVETVTIGNAGNTGETSGNGGWAGPVRICGAVDYNYQIGKYEVTTAQYTDFLNAVARMDTYGLYKVGLGGGDGHHIVRDGSEGSYMYSITPGWENRPINYINWGDAVRFVNWLHNGQPTGNQDATTTEDGAYAIMGKTSHADLLTVIRKSGWKYALPTEDEWYKAAFHKNDGVTGNYWDYATQSDSVPTRNFNGTNDANWYNAGYLLVGYYRNIVGEFVNCPGAYGAFDMNGNTWEWNETIGLKSDGVTSTRGTRGGSYALASHYMWSLNRSFMYDPTYAHQSFGFRVVEYTD